MITGEGPQLDDELLGSDAEEPLSFVQPEPGRLGWLKEFFRRIAAHGGTAFRPGRRALLKDLALIGLVSLDLGVRATRSREATAAVETLPPEMPREAFTLAEIPVRVLPGLSLPIPGFPIRSLPGSRLPNAARAYRHGTHGGFDLYAPYRTPVDAIADGIVTRADRHFEELPPELHRFLLGQSERLDATPGDILDRLKGRCVEIDHGIVGGIRWRSIYAHLSDVQVRAGDTVSAGDRIGNVGNSGTSAGVRGSQEEAHLHLEIRFQSAGRQERYLGQGMDEREIRRLLEEVFTG